MTRSFVVGHERKAEGNRKRRVRQLAIRGYDPIGVYIPTLLNCERFAKWTLMIGVHQAQYPLLWLACVILLA